MRNQITAPAKEAELITDDKRPELIRYQHELAEQYGLPKDFIEAGHIKAHKGEQIGLIAEMALHYLNYHVFALILHKTAVKQYIDDTVGNHIFENALMLRHELNRIGKVLNVESLGADWRQQARGGKDE